MTQDPSQSTEDRTQPRVRPAPDETSAPWADRWEVERWRGPVVGGALGVLTLPAVAMVIVGLLVLAVQGVATWLAVAGVFVVTTLLGAMGAVVAVRGGHRGVVHRLAVLSWVWGVVVAGIAVALALSLDSDERVAIAVILVLGGTYTLVLGLGLWVAARVLPAPVAPAGGSDVDRGSRTPPRGAPTVSDVPTQSAAPDDAEVLADWPEWGGTGPDPRAEEAPRQDGPEDVVEPAPAARRTAAVPARPAAPRRTAPAGDPSATELIARQAGDDGPPTQRLPPVAP